MNPSKLLDWQGRTCVIMASGPSLTDAQCAVVQAADVVSITTNTTWQKARWATVHYSCDYLWWRTYIALIQKAGAIPKCWTQDRTSAEKYGLHWVRQSARPGLGKKEIQVNGCSGFGALNLAYLFGCRKILMLGFDMQPGPQGKMHWHPDHPTPLVQKAQFGEWVHKSGLLARELKDADCSVLNCTPRSALTAFKTADLAEALAS